MDKMFRGTEDKSLALEIVHTLKQEKRMLYVCWLITFIAFICLLIYTISLLV